MVWKKKNGLSNTNTSPLGDQLTQVFNRWAPRVQYFLFFHLQ